MADANMCLEAARKAFPNDENLRVAYMLGFNEGFDKAEQKPISIVTPRYAPPVLDGNVVKETSSVGTYPEPSCLTCTNDKGCVTCVDKEQWEGKPQEELTEFEKAVNRIGGFHYNEETMTDDQKKALKDNAARLLEIALEQVRKELKETIGSDNKLEAAYALGCCDTREQLMREIKEDNAPLGSIRNPIDYQNEHFQKGVAEGRRLEREDMPKWRKYGNGACGGGDLPIAIVRYGKGSYTMANCLASGDVYIRIEDLEKLQKIDVNN